MRAQSVQRRPGGGLVLAVLVGIASESGAIVAGGGSPRTDCFAFFDGVDATSGATKVDCRDGDPCDADGIVDDVCTFDVRVCSPGDGTDLCKPRPVLAYSGTWVTRGYSVPSTPTHPRLTRCGDVEP